MGSILGKENNRMERNINTVVYHDDPGFLIINNNHKNINYFWIKINFCHADWSVNLSE